MPISAFLAELKYCLHLLVIIANQRSEETAMELLNLISRFYEADEKLRDLTHADWPQDEIASLDTRIQEYLCSIRDFQPQTTPELIAKLRFFISRLQGDIENTSDAFSVQALVNTLEQDLDCYITNPETTSLPHAEPSTYSKGTYSEIAFNRSSFADLDKQVNSRLRDKAAPSRNNREPDDRSSAGTTPQPPTLLNGVGAAHLKRF